MHKRFQNPRRGYARQQWKAEAARVVDDALAARESSGRNPEGMGALMGAPPVNPAEPQQPNPAPSTNGTPTPDSSLTTPPTEAFRKPVTRVVRGAHATTETRELSAAQRHIDRILAMLRRSR